MILLKHTVNNTYIYSVATYVCIDRHNLHVLSKSSFPELASEVNDRRGKAAVPSAPPCVRTGTNLRLSVLF